MSHLTLNNIAKLKSGQSRVLRRTPVTRALVMAKMGLWPVYVTISIISTYGHMIVTVIGCFGWSCFVILQSYPDELAMTAWICLLATIEGAIAAFRSVQNYPYPKI
ncbi:hypothetical protein Hdeb2414_s0010g00336831 [Helianthus debilis subsp. tardiflorus]